MKKFLILLAGIGLFFGGCSKVENMSEPPVEEFSASNGRNCLSHEIYKEMIQTNPEFRKNQMNIESMTKEFVEHPERFRLVNGVYEIPVVFNVLYRTTAENVSLSRLQSQIDVLNKDFGATNSDYNNAPSIFQSVRSGNTNIRFVLDQVIRKSTKKTSWTTNNAMKSSSQGGISPTSPTTKLNIWVCNMGGGILGYAQFPGGSSDTDGVVLDDAATGLSGAAGGPYNLGRTATHEVGHWLNLRHIWGDAACGDDFVNDTPTHNTSNGGCPTYPHYSTCSGTPVEMTMNYMDYTYDACMYMFTLGQKSRMLATFATGGGRTSFAQP